MVNLCQSLMCFEGLKHAKDHSDVKRHMRTLTRLTKETAETTA